MSHTTTTRPSWHRWVPTALAATALGVASPAVLAPAPAIAGTYEVKTCDDGSGSSEGWEIRDGNSNMAASKLCPSNGDQRRVASQTPGEIKAGVASALTDKSKLQEVRPHGQSSPVGEVPHRAG